VPTPGGPAMMGGMTGRPAKVTVGIPTFNRAALLRETIASVLAQSYDDFRLLVCDNASEDSTQETVASFDDPRIDYVRSPENIGMIANFNRAFELAETDFVVVLPDDDILYPDHLRLTVAALEAHPHVGVVHTAFDVIDSSSRVVERAKSLLAVDEPFHVEPATAYLERAMQADWTVCWPSALFRRQALVDAEGHRPGDEPLSDVPLLLRIARSWDFGYVPRTLAATRIHAESATAGVGAYESDGYVLHDQARILHEHRLRFLDETQLPPAQAKHYRSIAAATFRRNSVRALAVQAGADAPWLATARKLAALVVRDPRVLRLPATWRLLVAHLGGRYVKRAASRVVQPSA
jgi:glycosyl transferase family 2